MALTLYALVGEYFDHSGFQIERVYRDEQRATQDLELLQRAGTTDKKFLVQPVEYVPDVIKEQTHGEPERERPPRRRRSRGARVPGPATADSGTDR